MAFDRNATYGPRWAAPSVAHPQGAFIDRTTEVSDDGSYLISGWMNDISAFNEALIQSASITLDGTADEVGNSQYMEGLVEQVSGRSVNYDCSGPANAYVLSVRTDQYGPQSYFDGMNVEFTPNITNTGLSTVNVNSLGIITIASTSSGGELATGNAVRMRYNSSISQFEIISKINPGNVTTTQFNGGTIDQTFEQINFRSSAQPTGPQCNLTYDNDSGHTVKFTHNGTTGIPKFQVYNVDPTNPRMLQLEGTAPSSNMFVFGEVRSIRDGVVSAPEIVPNHDDFLYTEVIADEFVQNLPNKDNVSSSLGKTQFVTFRSQIITNNSAAFVAFPVTFDVAPPSVIITPFTDVAALNGLCYVSTIGTDTFLLHNFTGQDTQFCVMTVGREP